ncbi:MAG: hypothetical protein ACRDNZ_16315 [Streptosporangiaceae bacterium]
MPGFRPRRPPDVTPPGPGPLVADQFAVREVAAAAQRDAVAVRDETTQVLRPAGRRSVTAIQEDVAGSALARLTILPVLAIMAWLLPGLPLLLAGEFTPVPMLLICGPLLAGLVASALRVVPSRWPRVLPGAARQRGWASWFGLLGTVAVAAGFAAWQFTEISQAPIVLSSPGAYLQAGYWLAQHGSLPIPQSLAAFGGAHAGLGFSSLGFFAAGTSVVPLGTSGLPMLLAGGFWANGVTGAAALGPLLGGFAVLSFGGLIARLAGPQWAPAGALVLGLTLPEQYVARSAFTETALQVLLFGGLCLLIDALTRRARRPVRVLAWGLGGLALGVGVLVSLDALIYLLPVVPFAGLLLGTRRAGAASFCWGVVLGVSYGLADGYLLSRPFLDAASHLLSLIAVIAAWLIVLTAATVALLRVPSARAQVTRLAARRPVRWLPALTGLAAVATLIALAVRPYVQTVHGAPGVVLFRYIERLQRAQGLPLDPARTYAEDSLYWVIWYVGLPAVLLAGLGVALLAHQCGRGLLTCQDLTGSWRNWALPLGITCLGSAAILWDPEIVPGQPSASRRLVVIVLPGLISCAVWAAAWLTGYARERGAPPASAALAGLCCVAALAVPAGATAFGAGLTHAGGAGSGQSGGLSIRMAGLAFRPAGAGELAAVAELCSAIPPGSSVVILDRRVARPFTQVIRGMCGAPAGWMAGQPPSAVASVVSGIARAGRRPLLLGGQRGELEGFGGRPARVLDLTTEQEPHQLNKPPTALATVHFVIWMVVPRARGVGT